LSIITFMKLWILSDLHIESCVWEMPTPAPVYDVLIAAGDIHDPASHGVEWLAERSNGKPVIYVPGNHEWFAHKQSFTVKSETKAARKRAVNLGIHFLMDEAVIIGDVRFLCATLWTDWELTNNASAAMGYASLAMPDHTVIYPEEVGRALSPRQSQSWHLASRYWLEEELLKTGDWNKTVIVTHHLPHPHSISEKFTDSPLNPAFVSDLSKMVENCGAELWVHGHTHDSFDYQVGSTRIICNPKGYGPRTKGAPIENKAFNPMLVVQI